MSKYQDTHNSDTFQMRCRQTKSKMWKQVGIWGLEKILMKQKQTTMSGRFHKNETFPARIWNMGVFKMPIITRHLVLWLPLLRQLQSGYLHMMKKIALTKTPPESTCSVLTCWGGLLMERSWSVSGCVQKLARSRALQKRASVPYRAHRGVSILAVHMAST